MLDLDAVAGSVELPDAAAREQGAARQLILTKPTGALGRLEDLSIWLCGVQGSCPPRAFERPRVVVFAGDHGIAQHGVSAYPPEVTAQMVLNFVAGGAAVNVLARAAGAGERVADLSVDSDYADFGGVPDDVTQVGLLPVAYTTVPDFKPARRRPVDEIAYLDRWDNPLG